LIAFRHSLPSAKKSIVHVTYTIDFQYWKYISEHGLRQSSRATVSFLQTLCLQRTSRRGKRRIRSIAHPRRNAVGACTDVATNSYIMYHHAREGRNLTRITPASWS